MNLYDSLREAFSQSWEPWTASWTKLAQIKMVSLKTRPILRKKEKMEMIEGLVSSN